MKHALTFSSALLERAAPVKMVMLDVDGVLTDGGLYIGAEGEQIKRFHTLDGHGIKMLQSTGTAVAVISGRDSPALRSRMQALGVQHLALGVADKLAPANAFLAQLGLGWAQCAAMGDDWPDLPLLRHSALAFAPPGAHPEVQAVAHHITAAPGGAGAVREACDLLLQANGHYERLLGQEGQHA